MIAIISDIHGNYEALKEVLLELDNKKVFEIYCLGDVVGYYSQVNECCDELRKRKIECVMGNHDWYMASGTLCQRSHSVNKCLEYQRKIITEDNLRWIQSFQTFRRVESIAMVHGGWLNPIDEYLNLNSEYFDNIQGKCFVSGHSHVQMLAKCEKFTYCNPGSIGQPRDGDSRAAYTIYNEGNFEMYRVRYNINKVGELMEKAGFDSYYYGCLFDASKNLHT